MKSPYSEKKKKKKSLRTVFSKEEKGTPGFKAGRDRLTLLFCANAVKFTIRAAFICRAANSWASKGKDKHQLLVFESHKKAWTKERFFWIGSINALSLRSGSILPVKNFLLKLFSYWTRPLAPRTPRVQHRRHQCGLLASKHNAFNSD